MPDQEPETSPDAAEAPFSADNEGDAGAPPERGSGPGKLSTLEIVSLAAVALIVVGALAGFGRLVATGAGGDESRVTDRLEKPAAGALLGLASVETQWRPPTAADRVRPDLALIPEAVIRLVESPPAQTSFLKVIFRDETGTARGDVTPQKVENGRFAGTGDVTMSFVSTDGLKQSMQFIDYSSGRVDPWTVEIFEGGSYAAESWNRLAVVKVAPRILKPEAEAP